MFKLEDGMLFYHGSYISVDNIDLQKCSSGKDFGRGFYVTTSLEQARNFVRLALKRAKLRGLADFNQNYGFVSIYRYKPSDKIQCLFFQQANADWLHFVAGNRDASMFGDLILKYSHFNVIVGKIANDQTAAMLQAYIDGVNGVPGDERVDRLTVEALLPNKLEDQYCFRTKDSVECLQFVGSERYDI